jgi:hypothetical protein
MEDDAHRESTYFESQKKACQSQEEEEEEEEEGGGRGRGRVWE